MPKVQQAEFTWTDGMRRTRAYGECASCGWIGWTWDHVTGSPECHDCIVVAVQDAGHHVGACHCGEVVTTMDPGSDPFYVETFTNDEHAAHVSERGAVDLVRVLTLFVVLGIDVAVFVVLGRIFDGIREAGAVLS